MIGKVIYSRRNYCSIKITKNSTEQEQLVNGSICKIEKESIKKNKNNMNNFIIIVNFIII